jgi:hypothetical protein
MDKIKIGLIREGKVPPDKRVPLSPKQARQLMDTFPQAEVLVQSSKIRCFPDEEYLAEGIQVKENLEECDILMGVKEVPVQDLIPNKTYLFFSHTFKKQPYNAKLLKALLEKKIRLVDYEVLKYPDGKRIIGFGRYAGIAGCYSGFRAFGLKNQCYDLKPGWQCKDAAELHEELKKVKLPADTKIVLTGHGRVGGGAREILASLNLKEVSPQDFLTNTYTEPVFTHLSSEQCFRRKSDGAYDKEEFYKNPGVYESVFPKFAATAHMYVACHFWAQGAPFYFTMDDVKSPDWKINTVADISCDVGGPVGSTIEASTIEEPYYGFHRFESRKCDMMDKDAICVMAVDNLPCEIPRDASVGFGRDLMEKVLPLLIEGDRDKIIENACETNLSGQLTPKFAYLEEYAMGKIESH